MDKPDATNCRVGSLIRGCFPYVILVSCSLCTLLYGFAIPNRNKPKVAPGPCPGPVRAHMHAHAQVSTLYHTFDMLCCQACSTVCLATFFKSSCQRLKTAAGASHPLPTQHSGLAQAAAVLPEHLGPRCSGAPGCSGGTTFKTLVKP